MGKPKYGPQALAVAEKRLQALNMRAAGANYDDIAKALGYADRSGAYKAVQDAVSNAIKEPAQEVILLELQRLDRLLRGLWPAAIGMLPMRSANTGQVLLDASGQPIMQPVDIFAVDRVLSIMQRRAKLLGLDAPSKKQISAEWVMKGAAEQIASHYGLNAAEVLAEAERLLKSVSE